MRCPTLAELPPPPKGKVGWPWTEQSAPVAAMRPDGQPWPRITIVTPSYNQAQYIEETLRAVLLQGYSDLEYLVVDDSTDHTLEIVRKYEPWLQLIVGREKRGMSHAINQGWQKATGAIVTWIASDDVYLPGALAEVGRLWPKVRDCGVVVGGFHFMDEQSQVDPTPNPPRLPNRGPIDLTLVDPEQWRLHQVSIFYLREALNQVGCYVREDLHHNMDREVLYRVCRKFPAHLMEQPLACFRRHHTSKSWSVSNMVHMAQEYAELQSLFLTDDEADNARRRSIAAYREAKGYLKFAKYNGRPSESARALVKALRLHPRMALKRGYLEAWLRVIGLRQF